MLQWPHNEYNSPDYQRPTTPPDHQPYLPAPDQLSTADLEMAELTASGRLIITGGTRSQVTWESPSLGNGGVSTSSWLGCLVILNDANQNNRVSFEGTYWFMHGGVDE